METENSPGYIPVATAAGFYLYKINFVSWDQILSAKKFSFFGLSYMILRLKVRRPPFWSKIWWVPLYMGDLSASVDKWCPIGNPVRRFFDGETKRVSFSEATLLYLQALIIITATICLVSVF